VRSKITRLGDCVSGEKNYGQAMKRLWQGIWIGMLCALAPAAELRPVRNVLLFLTEDQGVDLGCMGTKGLDTPNIDAFAKRGVIFERAFCLSPVCSPSKMALFTGTYPHTNSAYRNVPDYGVNFPLQGDPSNLSLGGVHEDLPTLIEILRAQGYFTATSHKTHVQPIRKWPYHVGYGQPTTEANARAFVKDLVKRSGAKPFYMTFGIGAPHLPFRGILQNQKQWSPTGGLTGDGMAKNVDARDVVVPNCYPDVPGVRQDIADYYGAIECVDAVFGAVIDQLRELQQLDNTLVIFSSDHGMGLHRSKQSIYATGMRVPLIIGGAGIHQGKRIAAPVSHLDLLPTLLDELGIDPLPHLLGKSLKPLLRDEATAFSDRSTVMTAAHELCDGRAVCDGRYYYVLHLRKIKGASLDKPNLALNADQYSYRPRDYGNPSGPWFNRSYRATLDAKGTVGRALLEQWVTGAVPDEELFDLEDDPCCVKNLADEPSLRSIRATLRNELQQWRKRSGDYEKSPLEMKRRTAGK
jgi:N-sulfoglucosamine sulfohydrolase